MSSSPGDSRPVFFAIVRQARALCNAALAALFEYDGKLVYARAYDSQMFDPNAPAESAFLAAFPMAPSRRQLAQRCRAFRLRS